MANNYTVLDSTGATITMGSLQIGGTNQYPIHLSYGLNAGAPISQPADASGNLGVYIATAIPTGSNAIGSITNTSFAATQSGTWNVGTVTTVTTVAAVTAITNALPTGSNTIGAVNLGTLNGAATAAKQPALGSAGSPSTDVITVQGSVGNIPLPSVALVVNPTSTLTRPANTTAYAAGDLIANNTTAGSITVPTVSVARVNGGLATISRLRLRTSATTGMGAVNITTNLYTTAPTYTNGDNGVYAVATGAAGYIGTATFAFTQFADGAVATALIADGPINTLVGGSQQTIYWDMQTLSAFTPTSGQTFILTAEAAQS